MSENKTKTADNVGDAHDDGLWPDFEQSAESSVHENLPSHFGEDNLHPDEDASIESVKDGAEVLRDRGFGKDELYPDEDASTESAKDTAKQLEDAESARAASRTSEGDETPKKTAKKASASKKSAD